MKTMNKHFTLTAIAAALILTSCGGGGSSSTAPAAGSETTTPVVITCTAPQVLTNGVCATPAPSVTPAQNFQSTVPPPSYSDPLLTAAFNEVNAFRQSLGLGLMAQDTHIDTAAQNHVNYMVSNQIASDEEVSSNPGFTGVASTDRVQFVTGAYSSAGEVIGYTNTGKTVVDDLINSVYHRDVLMYEFNTDMGIGSSTAWYAPTVINVAVKPVYPSNASNFVTSYPLDQQTGVRLHMTLELPAPFADVTSANYTTTTSAPINVQVKYGSTLTVTSFTVNVAGQPNMTVRLITKDNDPNNFLGANSAYIVATQAFQANTTYLVNFSGTMNGAPITRSWSFTTGS